MALKADFIGNLHVIKIKSGQNIINVQEDLYSAAKDEWLNEVNNLQKYRFPFIVVGGDDIGGGQKAPSYYFLQHPWVIETSGDGVLHSFALNLYAQDETGDPRTPFSVLKEDSLQNETSNIPGTDLLSLIKNNIDTLIQLTPSKNEREQWRDSLGIDGTKRDAVNGQVQVIRDQSEISALNAVEKLNK